MEVGIAELKANLSRTLDRVAKGEIVIVTNRGKRIASIQPLGLPDAIERGLREGWITRKVDEPPRDVVGFPARPGAPSTLEIIRADRDA